MMKMAMIPLAHNHDAPIPVTRKGMDALVLDRLKAIDHVHICDTVPVDRFRIGAVIYGTLKTRAEHINSVYYIDDAERVLRSQEMGNRVVPQAEIDRGNAHQLIRDASYVVKEEYRKACIRLGCRLWTALRIISSIPTGEVLNGLYGDHPYTLVLTRIEIVQENPSSIAARYGGEKRLFRRRAIDTGQVTWLSDHGIACFKSYGLNFIANATIY